MDMTGHRRCTLVEQNCIPAVSVFNNHLPSHLRRILVHRCMVAILEKQLEVAFGRTQDRLQNGAIRYSTLCSTLFILDSKVKGPFYCISTILSRGWSLWPRAARVGLTLEPHPLTRCRRNIISHDIYHLPLPLTNLIGTHPLEKHQQANCNTTKRCSRL